MPPLGRAPQQAIARLRHMACLDDTGPHLVAPVLRELRHVVPFDSGGYFYPGEGGALDAYLESSAMQAAMPDYFDPRVLQSEGRVLCRSLLDLPEMARRQRGPLALEPGQILTVPHATLRRSDYYEAIMRPAQVATWMALVLCTPQGRGLGVLALYRHAGARPFRQFTHEELAALAPLETCLARVLQPGEPDTDEGEVRASGLLIASPAGRLLWTSPEAERLLPLAFGWRWRGPRTRPGQAGPLPLALQLLLQRWQWAWQGRAGAPLPQMEWRNAGGAFSLRATRMTAMAGQGDAVALHITQRVSRSTRLVEALQDWGLSPRQHALAYWMARGCSEPQIAARLGLSLPTVVHHRRALYERLGVHNRQGLLARAFVTPPPPPEG